MATKRNTNAAVDLKGILNTLEETTGDTTKEANINPNADTNINTNNDTNVNTTEDTNSSNSIKNQAKSYINDSTIGDTTKFILNKKVDDKKGKKAFNVYMQPDLIKELDKISKKSGYSRNELINLMCKYCVNNLEITESE